MPSIQQVFSTAGKALKHPATLMTGGAVGNAELWDKVTHNDRDDFLMEHIVKEIADGKNPLDSDRGMQGVVNMGVGSLAGGLASKGKAVEATETAMLSPIKDLVLKTIPAVDNVTGAADAVKDTSKSFKKMPLLLGGLGLGALGLGGLGLAKYLSGKKDKDKARIKYTLQGKEGDPSTQAEIDMPVDSPEFSENMLKGLNLGVKRQVGKSIKYNSLKKDPETGKMIPYEKWVEKYGSEKKASAEAPEEKRLDTHPDYKIVVRNGKFCCECCDGKPMSIEDAFNATRTALGLDEAGSLPTNEKRAGIGASILSGLAGGAVAAGTATAMPDSTNPLLKVLAGGAAGLGTALAGHGIASIGEPKDDGTMAGMQSYLNTGSAMAGFHGVPSIDSDEDDFDDDLEKDAAQGPPPPLGQQGPPPPQPQGVQSRVPVKPNPPAATPATGAADMGGLMGKINGIVNNLNSGATKTDPNASTPQTRQQASEVSNAMADVNNSLKNLQEMKQQVPSVEGLGKDLLDDYKANV